MAENKRNTENGQADLGTVLDKVRKLLRLANSNNANEAALAAAKAQELIDRHQIAQAMLSLDESTVHAADESIEDFGAKGAPLDTAKRLDRRRSTLAMTIARRNACKIYATGGTMHIIGRASDADTVRYLYAYFSRELDRLTETEGKGCGRTWRNNFRLGVVDTIGKRLYEQHQQTIRAVRAETSGTMALVRVNNAIARVDERRFEVERWAKENLKLYRRGGGSGAYDHSAREQGRKAGQHIAIPGSGKRGLASGTKRIGGQS